MPYYNNSITLVVINGGYAHVVRPAEEYLRDREEYTIRDGRNKAAQNIQLTRVMSTQAPVTIMTMTTHEAMPRQHNPVFPDKDPKLPPEEAGHAEGVVDVGRKVGGKAWSSNTRRLYTHGRADSRPGPQRGGGSHGSD